jgi:hypothetical protein
MAKHYSIGCNYRKGVECTHPQQPHGRKPSNGVCAKVCKLYDGPPATCTVVDEPTVKFTDATKPIKEPGCSPCAAAAKARIDRKKHDAAEAMRILNDAMNEGVD